MPHKRVRPTYNDIRDYVKSLLREDPKLAAYLSLSTKEDITKLVDEVTEEKFKELLT